MTVIRTARTITCPGVICILLLYSSKYRVNPPEPEGSRIRLSRAINKVLDGVSHLLLCFSPEQEQHFRTFYWASVSTCTSQDSPFHRFLHAQSGGSEHFHKRRRIHHSPVTQAVSFLVQSPPLLELPSGSDFVSMRYGEHVACFGWVDFPQRLHADSPAPSNNLFRFSLFINVCVNVGETKKKYKKSYLFSWLRKTLLILSQAFRVSSLLAKGKHKKWFTWG